MPLCSLCPRNCQIDRAEKAGFCGAIKQIKVARAALHMWEEPCISGTKGSGTIFFSGCQLKCCFCQNYKISSENFGKYITTEHLAELFLALQEKGAHNINLVSPTPYVPSIIEALDLVKHRLTIPVVYNSGGYEKVETIHLLKDYIDIYLPDLKYYEDKRAVHYSQAPHYYAIAHQAIDAMYQNVGPIVMDKEGLLKKGVIIRHMVMPGGRHDSIELMKKIAELPYHKDILVSVMSQFTPFYRCSDYPEINRRITTFEYDSVIHAMMDFGLQNGFMQEKSSAKEEYTPPFDLEGV